MIALAFTIGLLSGVAIGLWIAIVIIDTYRAPR